LGGVPKFEITKENANNLKKIKKPFVFGLFHTDISEQLDIPLMAALIEEKDC
jgi:hypothetical protein